MNLLTIVKSGESNGEGVDIGKDADNEVVDSDNLSSPATSSLLARTDASFLFQNGLLSTPPLLPNIFIFIVKECHANSLLFALLVVKRCSVFSLSIVFVQQIRR